MGSNLAHRVVPLAASFVKLGSHELEISGGQLRIQILELSHEWRGIQCCLFWVTVALSALVSCYDRLRSEHD